MRPSHLPAALTALAAALVLTLAPTAASAAPTQLLATLNVTADSIPQNSGSVTLTPGATYRLVMSGSISITFPFRGGSRTVVQDALFCYDHGGTPIPADDPSPEACQRDSPGPARSRPMVVSYAGIQDGPPINEGYSDQHRYDVTFVYRPSGPAAALSAQWLPGQVTSHGGSIKVELYGEPGTSPPSTTKPADDPPSPTLNDLLNGDCAQGFGGSPIFRIPRVAAHTAAVVASRFCPKRLKRVSRWNRPTTIADLVAGAEATFLGPALSSSQRGATVTLSTSTGDVAVALTDDDAKFRRYARRSCFILAHAKQARELFDAGLVSPFDSTLDPGAFTQLAGVGSYLLPCLKIIDDALAPKSTRAAPTDRAAARAAAAGCRAIVFPIKATSVKSLDSVRLTTRDSYPLPNTLRVTCRATARGVAVHVRPRRSGVTLRQVVGARLSVGLLRAPGARGTARGTISFSR